jgi:hypothetical protein
LILMAQTIVRIIIGIDKNLNLLEIRKSKLWYNLFTEIKNG